MVVPGLLAVVSPIVGGTTNRSTIWINYGFSITNSSMINNVTVLADFSATNANGFINVRVSPEIKELLMVLATLSVGIWLSKHFSLTSLMT